MSNQDSSGISFGDSGETAKIGLDFLAEYWKSPDDLPLMSSSERYLGYLARSFHNIRSQSLSSGVTILTIASSLLILGGVYLTLKNFSSVVERSGGEYQFTAYLDNFTSKKSSKLLLERLNSDERVREVELTSKKQALEQFRKALEDKSFLLDGLVETNPLPASIDILLARESSSVEQLDALVSQVRDWEGVDDIAFGSSWAEKAGASLRVFRFFTLFALIITASIVVFLVANTIRLVLFAQEDEISIMRLVGASNERVDIPFLISGFLQGLAGAIIGLFVLRAALLPIGALLEGSDLLGVAIDEISYFSTIAVILIIFLSGVVGMAGSYFALRQYRDE